jgi:putative MATE family efflux protein
MNIRPDEPVAAAKIPAAIAAPALNRLLTAPILPTLARLSLPNMIAMMATALVAIAETSYVGRLGVVPLAGMALVFPMVMLQQMMSAGAMGGGISSAISRALGAGEDARAQALAFHAVLIGAFAGVFFMALFLVFGAPIYRALGGRGPALAQALAYSNVLFVGAASIWLTNTFASIVRGGGNMKVPSFTLLTVAASQAAIGGTLGLGLGPVPRLGMPGIAAGQVIVFTAGALFLLWYLRSGRARVRLSFATPISWPLASEILRVGALACLSPLQSVLTVLVVTRLVSEFGTEALAGYGIGARLEFLLIPITFAIGVACVPLIGMAVGAGQIARARRVAWTSGAAAALLVGSVGLLVASAPDAWAGLFTRDPAVLASARSYFAWAGPIFGFFGLGISL